jgi:membrane fusion protein, multidrug efflux system
MKIKSVFGTIVLLTTISLLAGCGSTEKAGDRTVPTVEGAGVETVHLQTLPDNYEAVGTVRSATSSVLGAQISGTVREIRVMPGDRVRRGQVLARLDDRSPRAELAAANAGVEESQYGVAETEQALQAAEAQRKLAEDTYHRYQNLLERNSVTRQEFDGAEARYKSAVANQAALEAKQKQMQARGRQAQSQQESARTLLSYSTIVSPIDGVVTAKSVDAGTLVMPGTPLLTVEDTAHMRLEASVPQEFIMKIHMGQKTDVSTDEGQWPGTVVEIDPSTDTGTRSFVVKVALPSTCPCRSGEYGKAIFGVGEARALAVPRSAVLARGELEGVYVVNPQGAAEYRLVTLGKIFGEQVEILSGLSDGERVVISHLDQLTDGARVASQ